MDGYTEQVDLVKIKLRQKQALGLLAGAIADELTGEAETLSGAWAKLVQAVKKYFAF